MSDTPSKEDAPQTESGKPVDAATACSAIWMRGMMRTRYMLARKLSEISSLMERDITAREEIKKQIKEIDAQAAPWRVPMVILPPNDSDQP